MLDSVAEFFGLGIEAEAETPTVNLDAPDTDATSTAQSIVNAVELPSAAANTAAGVFLNAAEQNTADSNAALMLQAESAALEEEESADSSEAANDSNKPETGKADASVNGNGDGNGQVPPGQTEDENGNIVNGGGNMAPGLNRGNKLDKPENPNKPSKPENPGTEDKSDKKANKANKGTHIYTYDSLNRMVSSNIAKTITKYTYDTLGNLVLETVKNKSVDYQYNELNQLVKKTTTQNKTFTYSYDKRGNRIAETGKKASQQFEYDAANRLVKGINWKSDVSEYTYNGLGLRVNNLVTTHANKTYDRDYVIDYTSPENDDLYVYALGNGQLEYEQRHVYAGSERLEQITEKGNGGWERTLYVHEDVMGNTRYYTKATGQSFAELEYDAWGQPVSPNKLVNNDHGNYVFATFTGHIYDTTLDIYFAEARFYDAANRQWLAMDPVKDGLNWYRYTDDNPTTYWDPYGNFPVHLVVGAVTGAVIGGVGTYLEYANSNRLADKKMLVNIAVNTAIGAVTGTVVALGLGTTGVAGVAADVVSTATAVGILGGTSAGAIVSGATGGSIMNGAAGAAVAAVASAAAVITPFAAPIGAFAGTLWNGAMDPDLTMEQALAHAGFAMLVSPFIGHISGAYYDQAVSNVLGKMEAGLSTMFGVIFDSTSEFLNSKVNNYIDDKICERAYLMRMEACGER